MEITPFALTGTAEWTSSPLARYDDFKAMDLYPGYTEDFFDTKHNIILGGSWATHPRIAGRKTFINWYQRSKLASPKPIHGIFADSGFQTIHTPGQPGDWFAMSSTTTDMPPARRLSQSAQSLFIAPVRIETRNRSVLIINAYAKCRTPYLRLLFVAKHSSSASLPAGC